MAWPPLLTFQPSGTRPSPWSQMGLLLFTGAVAAFWNL